LFICLYLQESLISEVQPNVLIMLSDDLGFKDVGCYGGPVKTPTIDQLAKEGTRFTDFYSGCAVCSPSRATLLTGRHHIRTGVYSWINNETQRSHLLLRENTLAELLKAKGYATAHVGKWHLGLPTETHKKPTPSDHGFDHWFVTDNNAIPSHHNPTNFIRNGAPVGEIKGYSCQIVVDEAIHWLEQRRDAKVPFFLNVWFHEPHAPLAAPDDLVSNYGKLDDKGALYSGTIDNEDRAMKRLLNKLQALGVRDDTIIIYASDNGSYRNDRVGELRDTKGSNYDGGIRVPGIFSWPKKIKSGIVLNEPAGLVDVVPTICELLDVDMPSDRYIDGSSLTPLLLGKPQNFLRHQPLFWHLQKSRPIVAMRDGKYSLVAEPDFELSKSNMFDETWIPTIKTGRYKEFKLYDLSKDPGQKNDLALKHPELVESLKLKLMNINDSIMKDGADWHL